MLTQRGSANDYRTLDDYGIAGLMNYVGMDITDQNISNAKSLFPSIDFRVGDASNTGFGDSQFDCVIVFDLFEHLSLSLMQEVLTELIRVSKRELILIFFNLEDIPSHLVKPHPVKSYHWNTLSKRELMSYISQDRKVIGVEALSLFLVNPVEFEFSGGKNSNNWLWSVYLSP